MIHRASLIRLIASCLFGASLLLAAHAPLEASTTEGRTPGSFAVSPSGAATYSIPIWAPPGPRGVQPNIALAYDSNRGNGPVGVGWTIAGLGAITRCNLTYAQDSTPAAVGLVTSDGYCINGQRLRLTSGTYGTAGSVYQTEIADFSQITANGTAGNGPAYFSVQARSGLTYYYGYTDSNGKGANSEVVASGTTTAVTWLLSKVTDRAGNSMAINYIAGTSTAVPGTIYWTPASAGSSTYDYQMIFTYTTNNPQTSIYGYVAGAPLTNVNLLTDITVQYTSTVVKKYVLSYQTSPTTGRNELMQVQECADAGATNCLLPTKITYQVGGVGLSSTAKTAISSLPISNVGVSSQYDFNGDGYNDLYYSNGSTLYVSFASAGGFGTGVNTGISASAIYLIGDVLGTGKDGFLVDVSGTWWYYAWNGTSFTSTDTGVAVSSYAATGIALLYDVDGDGLPDIVTWQEPTSGAGEGLHLQTQINTSAAGVIHFSATVNDAFDLNCSNCGAEVFVPGYGSPSTVRKWDFNGDGRGDLLFYEERIVAGKYNYSLVSLTSQGTTFTSAVIANYFSIVSPGSPFVVDWNNDSCDDVIYSGFIYLSPCNGASPSEVSLSGNFIGALDWDGDGRTDLLVANGSTIGVYQSTATGLSALISTSIPFSSNCGYFIIRPAGDGQDALGCWSQTAPYQATYYPHNGTVKTDLAASFTDGYGNAASPTYVSLAQNNYTEHYKDATYPDQDYIGSQYVVSEAIFSDPSSATGATYNQTFWYYGAWMNLQGRGFEGFGAIETTDSRNGLYDLRYFSTAFPFTGMRYQEDVSNATFNFSQTTGIEASTTLSSTPHQQRYFPYFSQLGAYQWEVGGPENADLITTTDRTYTYDNYGNVTDLITTVTDNDPGSPYNGISWSTDVINTTDISANQSADLSAWCLTMLDEQQIVYESTLSGATTVTRTKTFTPDTPSACRIKTIVTEPTANSGLYKVTEALTFDSFGNIATDTIAGANMPSSPASRKTQLNWGTTGQFVQTKIDPSSATTTWSYSSNQALTFGVPDSVKDANNLTTSWSYDAFGRKIKEVRPDGTSTGWGWSACTSKCGWSNSVYQIAQTIYQTNGTTAIRTDTNSYDPSDRVTQTSGPNVTGSSAIVQTLYNSLGLRTQQSLPFLSGTTAYQQTFGYDLLNRLTSATRPISSTNSSPQTTSYAYAGRKTTVSDPYGHNKITVKDVNGWLRRATDAIGYTVTRAYDAAGSVNGITDSAGNTLRSNITTVYGIKPFVTAATDADRGAWTYTVDSLGERTSWSDAKGQSFSMTYDALSRPLTRTEPDLYSQWTWGSTPASYNVGKLIGECTGSSGACSSSSGYSETRTFDSYGRLSTRSITEGGNPGNDPGGVFLITSGYSTTTGFLNTLTYPKTTTGTGSPLVVQYGYGYGLLQSLTDTSDTTATCGTTCVLWTANAMNGFGQITQETLGNGVVTNRSFDAVTSWLKAATAGVGGGSAILNQSYLEDENGNVTQRQNNNLGLTESFAYDGDNRLTCAALSSSCSASTFVYDSAAAGPGNTTTQVGVGTYSYPAAGQPRPHAVTSIAGTFNGITNPTFSYDANGNMTNRASTTQNVYWFSSNYPLSISAMDVTGTEEVQFSYGPDRQRWEQVYSGPSGTEKTYYIGGLIDMVFSASATSYRQYIYAGSEPVAVYSRSSTGTNTMSYMLEDHQGGVSAIASSAGAVDIDESFSAFGQRRNPSNWSGPPTSSDLTTIAGLSRQGYTFQTWLGQSMGLNHMNGRVQDAILGRFLSPDPHIPDPTNAQSYNRYSYVNNNPMTLGDPSGFAPQAAMHCYDDCYVMGDAYGTLGGFWALMGVVAVDGSLFSSPTGFFNGFSSDSGGQGGAQNGSRDTSGQKTPPAQDSPPPQDSPPGQSQFGLGLSDSQWSQLSQLVDGAQTLTPLDDPSSAGQPAVPGAATPDQIQKANDAWDNFEDATQQGNQGDADYWLRQYYDNCGCSAGPADSGGPPYSPPRPNPTPTPPSFAPPTLPSPPISVPAPSL